VQIYKCPLSADTLFFIVYHGLVAWGLPGSGIERIAGKAILTLIIDFYIHPSGIWIIWLIHPHKPNQK